MYKDPRGLLMDMLLCMNKVEKIIGDVDFDEFVQNILIFDTTVLNIQQVGEACRKLPEDFRKANPQINWRDIINMRHRLTHDYFGIIPKFVYDTALYDLPILKAEILKLL